MNLRVFYLTRRGISDGYGKTCLILPCRILLPLQLPFISHVARYAPSSRQL